MPELAKQALLGTLTPEDQAKYGLDDTGTIEGIEDGNSNTTEIQGTEAPHTTTFLDRSHKDSHG